MNLKAINWKLVEHYVVSSVVSFFTGFLLAVMPYLQDLKDFHWNSGMFVGTVLMGVRAGVKVLVEYLVPQLKLLVAYLQNKFK